MFFVVEHDAQIVANIPRRVRLLSHCNFQHDKVRLLRLLVLLLIVVLLSNRFPGLLLLLFVGCSSLLLPLNGLDYSNSGLLRYRLSLFLLLLSVGCRSRRLQLRGIEVFDIFRTHPEKVLPANIQTWAQISCKFTTYFVSLKSMLVPILSHSCLNSMTIALQ